MSVTSSTLAAVPRATVARLFVLSLWAGLFCLLPVAALCGGMAFVIIVLAAGLAVLVWSRPKEAASAGVLFLIACNVFFPTSARYGWAWRDYEPWQMQYWALGLLIITLAAAARIGIGVLWRIPASVKAILLVSALATLVGFARGNAASFIIRQLYGSLLLVAYFAFAYHAGDEELFLRRLRKFGLLCAGAFFVYYAAEFTEYGFHKEITNLGTLEGGVAILCFAKGLAEKRRGWMVSALVLMAVPFLLFERKMLITFTVAGALALAIKTSSRKARYLYVGFAVLTMLPGMLVSSAGFVLEKMEESIPGITDLLPGGGADVYSLTERTIQLGVSVEVLGRSPAVGEGFGAEISWDRPHIQEFVQQAYIDNGWAYVAVKMGGLGLLVFIWFLATTLRCVSPRSLGLSACLLSMLLVTMFSEPVFLNFNSSCLLGAMAGLLCARKARELKAKVPAVFPVGCLALQPERPKGI